ncbi:MAG: 4Fe-4S dicluster domain-containing protein [Trueperaceae bacterium]|nr:4Fe-4S dicluster domain-containing protein [Trueperaceae bacterium]
MQHNIPAEPLGAYAEPMTEAVSSCVHCGFCLPTCPTYRVMGEEMDSPRGRIFLMKEVLEGSLELDMASPYIDNCLGCMACVTACPSGVQYQDLLTPFRALAEEKRERKLMDKILRRFVLETLPYPHRFRLAAFMGQFAKPFKGLLRGRMADMLALLPERLPKGVLLPVKKIAEGETRARVALLAGCAQQVLEPDINSATLNVLAQNGVEVLIPEEQVCCGALAAHTGAMWQAKRFAKENLKAFAGLELDAIITNAAGCGSGLHEYPLWLKGEPEEEVAKTFAHKAQDITVFLSQLGIKAPPAPKQPLKIAYHDACHLAHAQGVVYEPRELLGMIPDIQVFDIADSEVCCGSAGTYNIEHPDTAFKLGQEKAQNVLATGADMVVTGNIGCMTQLRTHLKEQGIPVMHTVQLLDKLYRGEL